MRSHIKIASLSVDNAKERIKDFSQPIDQLYLDNDALKDMGLMLKLAEKLAFHPSYMKYIGELKDEPKFMQKIRELNPFICVTSEKVITIKQIDFLYKSLLEGKKIKLSSEGNDSYSINNLKQYFKSITIDEEDQFKLDFIQNTLKLASFRNGQVSISRRFNLLYKLYYSIKSLFRFDIKKSDTTPQRASSMRSISGASGIGRAGSKPNQEPEKSKGNKRESWTEIKLD